MPLKTFLAKIREMFLENESKSGLNTLTDYLRSLDTTKKSILTNLKQTINDLAE